MRQPGDEPEVVAQLGRALGERDRRVDRLRAGRRVAAEDLRHPDRRRGQEARAGRRVGGQRRPRALGDRQHLDRVARGEAGAGRLGEHRDRALGVGPLGRRGQDRVAAHDRAAVGRDVAGELVDLDDPGRVAAGGARLVEQRHGAVGEPGEPGRLGRLPQQPRAPLGVGREPPGALERRRRGRVGAALAAARAGLRERRRRRVVRADRRGGEVPGAPVDVAIGQRGGERPVRLAALRGGRVGVDRRAGERMAELDRARAAARRGPRSRRRPARRRRSRARPRRARAAAGRRCRSSPRARARAGRARRAGRPAARTRARSAPGSGPGRPRERTRARARRTRARAAPAGCRRSRRAAAAPRRAPAPAGASPRRRS